MKLGDGRRAEAEAKAAAGAKAVRRAAAGGGRRARGGRRGGGQPRDPEAGFRSLGRWGIKNVVATRADRGWPPLCHRRRTEASYRHRRQVRNDRRRLESAFPSVQPYRPGASSRNHAGRKPAARPRHRADSNDDQELRGGENPVHQIQHEHPGSAADRPRPGPRRHVVHRVQAERRSRRIRR